MHTQRDAQPCVRRPYLVRIVGVYAIHPSEREAIRSQGPATVWDSGWDPYDPGRPAVS
ncbi:hypothetical protein ACFWA5_27905 [Streptomyces mirabilis]|uniref:hypothetical protein n=1 Tax=Streptomyces mirabilis TaxID=68239 RepID=UPI00366295C4